MRNIIVFIVIVSAIMPGCLENETPDRIILPKSNITDETMRDYANFSGNRGMERPGLMQNGSVMRPLGNGSGMGPMQNDSGMRPGRPAGDDAGRLAMIRDRLGLPENASMEEENNGG